MTRKTSFPKLDSNCLKLLFVLMLVGRKIRFNALHELLENNKIFISKPTLSLHLRHLREAKLALQKLEGAQNVSYEINHRKFGAFEEKFKATSKIAALADKIEEEQDHFMNLPINDQMKVVLLEATGRFLKQFELRIKLKSNPSNWEDSIELLFLDSPFFAAFEACMFEKSGTDEDYRENVLQRTGELINRLQERTDMFPWMFNETK